MAAFIDGDEVSLQAAVREAVRVLASARLPVVAGLGTDIAGGRAAIKLAARIGAAVDHMHAGALLRDLDVMRETGMMVTTPSEARLRADLYLLVGQSLAAAPDMQARLLADPPLRGNEADEAIQETRTTTGLLRSARTKASGDGLSPPSPPPLRGRDREGGEPHTQSSPLTPLPNPPPQGGREQVEPAAGAEFHPRRRIVWLCPPRKTGLPRPNVTVLGRHNAELPTLLALLRARLHGHPVAVTGRALAAIDAAVADVKAARFGVAVWSANELDALSIEMLCTLVDDLNAETRFSGVPLPPPDNGRGILEACGWATGFPVRVGFGRGVPEHDPWRFDSARLVDSGECDGALWISAYGTAAPDWHRDVPTVILTAPGRTPRPAPRVLVEVGTPGIDHDAVAFNPLSGTLMPLAASPPNGAPTVAGVIAELLAALPQVPPC